MTRLFICTPTYYLHGGVERILESLAIHLPAHGFQVTFGLVKGARFHDPAKYQRAFPAIVGVEVDGTSGSGHGRRRALRRAIVAADPDVVLMARIFDTYPVCSELKQNGHRLRLAITIQAYEPEYVLDLARYVDFVDCCITSGELVAQAAKRAAALPPECVRSIPGGITPARHPQVPGQGRLRIGYVGRLEQQQKRVLDLPLLLAELDRRHVPFDCMVAGDGSVAAALRSRMPTTRFRGWLSPQELYETVYPYLDVLVHFAEWEGITIAPREAMAHGVVPVVSRFIGLEAEGQFVDGVNALVFPVGDVAAAAQRIEGLHRDRTLLQTLAGNAPQSQGGIRSEQGAVNAWAAALQLALARPARTGVRVPAVGRDEGLLTRLFVPNAVAEVARRLRSRPHSDPGSEWPHWSGIRDEELSGRIEALGKP